MKKSKSEIKHTIKLGEIALVLCIAMAVIMLTVFFLFSCSPYRYPVRARLSPEDKEAQAFWDGYDAGRQWLKEETSNQREGGVRQIP